MSQVVWSFGMLHPALHKAAQKCHRVSHDAEQLVEWAECWIYFELWGDGWKAGSRAEALPH
jgi:hypothetical protein